MDLPKVIDLHMHTTVSDGTDTPEQILANVKAAGIEMFAVTDHDDFKGCNIVRSLLGASDPRFITGVEFSCRDEDGKYHILGYGFDPDAASMRRIVETGHRYRMNKVRARLDLLDTTFGFKFSDEDRNGILSLNNPGKPHIGNLMVKYGYAPSKEEAINEYINKLDFKAEYVRPEDAIEAILSGGGIPVLAHPSYGSGDQLIIGEDMDARLRKLMGFGIQGVEAFYSGFTPKLRKEMIGFAEKYNLYVTAGSDYHGTNKMIPLGDTDLTEPSEWPDGLIRFLKKMA